jgi:hydroxyacylglutathione hydrolase
MTLEIHQFPCRSDNYGVLAHDAETGATASIDAPDEAAVRAALRTTGWRLTHILTTHHHADHVAGNLGLKAEFGCEIAGPAAEAARIPGIDRGLREGDEIAVGGIAARVIETPGHTAGHISYHLPEAGVAFVGDTLFAMGCGRLFEGDAETMWRSLTKIAALPDDTRLYCGHEYTLQNAKFARSVEPGNAALAAREAEVEALRADGLATLPTTLAAERATNPFLRAASAEIRSRLGLEDARDADVFAALRKLKDAA